MSYRMCMNIYVTSVRDIYIDDKYWWQTNTFVARNEKGQIIVLAQKTVHKFRVCLPQMIQNA